MSSVSVNIEVAWLFWIGYFFFFLASHVGEDPNNAGIIRSEQSNVFNIVLPEYKSLRMETFDEDGVIQSHCIVRWAALKALQGFLCL